MYKSISLFALAVICPSFSLADAHISDDIVQLCGTPEIQTSCMTTCAPSCGEAQFLAENASYCLSNNLIGQDATPAADSGSCQDIFRVDVPLEVAADLGACDQLDIFEQRECILAQITPGCSATVSELDSRARLLVAEIENELLQYGELLERDWATVNDGQSLCQFSREELSEFYTMSTQNPELLKALQRRGSSIQSCSVEWEEWMRNADVRNTPGLSTDLIDTLTRETEQDLGSLRAQIQSLNTSTATLEGAAATVLGIIDLHIIQCDVAAD